VKFTMMTLLNAAVRLWLALATAKLQYLMRLARNEKDWNTRELLSFQPFKVFALSFSIGVQPILWKRLSHLVVHLDGDVLGIFEHVGHCTAVLLLVQQ